MKKIPTVFERDWAGDRSRVVDKITPGCEWVASGEGVATRKIDGTCCLIRDTKLYKRREVKPGAGVPMEFELVDQDEETGKMVGWVPVGLGPEDQWHRAAFNHFMEEGTYELVGPRVQGNPEKYETHRLVRHDQTTHYDNVPRDFSGLREWLKRRDIEGVVFHHPDGRMAKIKLRDFGLKRGDVEQNMEAGA